ncbi:MAG TPA: hypothetical protein VG963_23730, partial [Polyangiaceae bacterium]|nr:hypothetical protein [Polyangiaceae bacterium]
LSTTLATAMAETKEWSERVRAGLAALLGTLSEHPEMARFFLIAPPGAGDAIADRHHEAMRELVGELTAGAPPLLGGGELSAAGEQAIAGGISRLVIRKLNDGGEAQVPELLPVLVEQTLRPFVGAEEAAAVVAGKARGGS